MAARPRRIRDICSLLERCSSFADVGCDHGYCAEYVLERGLCDEVYVSDISEKSLSKAERLLARYIADGRCRPVRCDGLEGFDPLPEFVLIAGMGGEEIIRILSESGIPERFLLQPMHNAPKVREYLLSEGCALTYDGMIRDGRFYFVMKGRRGGACPAYSEEETMFGRDSLSSPLIVEFLSEEMRKCDERLLLATTENGRREIGDRKKYLGRVMERCRQRIS